MSEGAVSDTVAMIAGMAPVLDDQSYSFAVLGEGEEPPEVAFALVREAEGITVISPALDTEKSSSFARITLQVHSDLVGVGLTAAVSSALAERGIACNVIAGFYHDHLFVPWDRREQAMQVLQALAKGGGLN